MVIDSGSEALFLSCTGFRAVLCIVRAEGRIGKPGVSSNQAMIWRRVCQIGWAKTSAGHGRLFQH
ncbi:hypothetical protein [Roseovarius litorisediminis]|uniref:aspartate racemase/maleate isomerase family protein n=1 Tax=Roseovarius litorisediminis TaxID=1312363 RepID=UPI001594B08C